MKLNIFSRIFTKLQLAQAHISFFFHKKITININGFEILINEGLEGGRHFSEWFVHTIFLNSGRKFFCVNFTVLKIFSGFFISVICIPSFDYCVVSTTVVHRSFSYLYRVCYISFSFSKVSDILWVNSFAYIFALINKGL